MSDLYAILPNFSFTNTNDSINSDVLLSLLDKFSSLPVADLLTLPIPDLSRRFNVPILHIRYLVEQIVRGLQEDVLGITTTDSTAQLKPEVLDWNQIDLPLGYSQFISSMDPVVDRALNGGFPTRYLTEIVGESGTGKTQFLLTLLLAVQFPVNRGGLDRPAVYISTESPLPVTRLEQIATVMRSRTPGLSIGLDQIFSIHTPDLEAQNHILRYQLPVLVQQRNVGLVIIDSITANYRAEFAEGNNQKSTLHPSGVAPQKNSRLGGMALRRLQLIRLGALLRDLAVRNNCAVVVSNQVSDRFEREMQYTLADSQQKTDLAPFTTVSQPLTLDHQLRWFSGWGTNHPSLNTSIDPHHPTLLLKTPSLGLPWAHQIGARIALIRTEGERRVQYPDDNEATDRMIVQRQLKVVYAPWTSPESDGMQTNIDNLGSELGFIAYEIHKGGIRGLPS